MRSPLKLLLTTDAVGGVWTYTIDLAQALRKGGVNVCIAALGPPPSAAQVAQAAATGADLCVIDAPLDWLCEDEVGAAQASCAIAAQARQLNVDVIQVHSPALLAHALMPAPTVCVVHSCVATRWEAVYGGDMPDDLLWRAMLTEKGLARANVVIASNQSFANDITRIYGIAKPIVVNNARKPADAARDDSASFVLAVGRFWDEGKNLATLDCTAAICAWPIVAAGPLVSPHGQQRQTAFVDARGALDVDTLRRLYAQRPIFCSSAVYEPFGLAVLEAAQAGCALVLSSIPTFRELWADAALFAPPRDAKAFASTLNALARDHAWRRELGLAASARAAQFSTERQAHDMRRVYESALQTARCEASA